MYDALDLRRHEAGLKLDPINLDGKEQAEAKAVDQDPVSQSLQLLYGFKNFAKGNTAAPRREEGRRTLFSALTEVQMQALGHYALPYLEDALDAGWQGDAGMPDYADYAASLSGHYFNFRKTTIYGGSNEIQKKIISQMMLGL